MRPSSMALALCVTLPLACSAAEQLNIKPGLWEVTTTTRTTGVFPLPKELLDTMTAEQQAKMRADMRAAQDKPATNTSRECITQKDLERPFASADTEKCKQSIASTTRTSQEVRIVCEGEPRGNGILRITTPTPDTMTGVLDLKLGSGSDSSTMKADMKGRRLGTDCGEDADEDADADADTDADSDADAGLDSE